MSTTNTTDLSCTLLILGSFPNTTAPRSSPTQTRRGFPNKLEHEPILNFSQNCRYEFGPPTDEADKFWKGAQSPKEEPKPPFLALNIRQHIRDPSGWVFGSDPDLCDIQLARDKQDGVSRRVLRIDICPASRVPRIQAIGSQGDVLEITVNGRKRRLKNESYHLIQSRATIELLKAFPPFKFEAWVPKRTTPQRIRYMEMTGLFSADVINATARYKPEPGEKIDTSTPEEFIRYSSVGTAYVKERESDIRSGGSGSVMMVKERTSGDIFGAKALHQNPNDSHNVVRTRLEDLAKEFKNIVQLDHPHIVKVFEFLVPENPEFPPWMIIEYIRLNLTDAIPHFVESERLVAMSHLSSALHYIHRLGFTHRDIKPDNALVQMYTSGIVVKLADFGASKQNSCQLMKTMAGTLPYLAPELFDKFPNYTNKIDMWSLGLIGIQIFTTWNPKSNTRQSQAHFEPWMCDVIIPFMGATPKPIQHLLKRLLRKDGRKRWSALKCFEWLSPLVAGLNTGDLNTQEEGILADMNSPADTTPDKDHRPHQQQQHNTLSPSSPKPDQLDIAVLDASKPSEPSESSKSSKSSKSSESSEPGEPSEPSEPSANPPLLPIGARGAPKSIIESYISNPLIRDREDFEVPKWATQLFRSPSTPRSNDIECYYDDESSDGCDFDIEDDWSEDIDRDMRKRE